MKTFPYGNPGPYDAELVELVLDIFGELDEDDINKFIDNVNDVFQPVIEKAWQYDELCD